MSSNDMQFVSLKKVAGLMGTCEEEMAALITASDFDPATARQFADYVHSSVSLTQDGDA